MKIYNARSFVLYHLQNPEVWLVPEPAEWGHQHIQNGCHNTKKSLSRAQQFDVFNKKNTLMCRHGYEFYSCRDPPFRTGISKLNSTLPNFSQQWTNYYIVTCIGHFFSIFYRLLMLFAATRPGHSYDSSLCYDETRYSQSKYPFSTWMRVSCTISSL